MTTVHIVVVVVIVVVWVVAGLVNMGLCVRNGLIVSELHMWLLSSVLGPVTWGVKPWGDGSWTSNNDWIRRYGKHE